MHGEQRRLFFNRIAAGWDEMGKGRRRVEGLEEFVRVSYVAGAQMVLDVGCGTGVLVPHLLKSYPEAQAIVEMDYAEEMLAVNRQKFTDPRLVRLAADAAHLPFPDEAVDVILCFNAAPHFGQGDEAFRELFRVLTPGGKLAVGHLMSSEELNRFHGSLQGPVSEDRLRPAAALGEALAALGGVGVVVEERPGWYFVQAAKAN